MIRVGIVDLDNSHPIYFTPIINRSENLRVTAIYDHGDVQSRAFVEQFAQEHHTQICASLSELVAAVDVGMVLSQNWDCHLARVLPFMEAGKPVFLEKPLVGRRRDAEALLALAARTGTPIMGGSSMRYADEVTTLRAKRAELGRIYSAFACGPGDFLNYGCHVMAAAGGFFGAGVEAVSYLGQGQNDLFLVEQRNGPPIIMQLSAGINYPNNPCFLALSTERGLHVATPRGGWAVSEALIREFVQFVQTGKPSVPFAEVLEEALTPLLAAEARRTGRRITLSDVPLDAGFDGYTYTADYARGGGYQGTGLANARAVYSAP